MDFSIVLIEVFFSENFMLGNGQFSIHAYDFILVSSINSGRSFLFRY